MIEDFSIKMDDPKEPDDSRNWRAMDVYIFANGQQNSPPRKYHLESDQLEWWPITLSYIAGTQYGSVEREIDLYTIDGNKIETPLELKNDVAYVAVQKPDDFIDAGYEKYLIKATKSWERRQLKKDALNNHIDHEAATKDDARHEEPIESSEIKVFHPINRTPDNSIMLQTISHRHSVDSSSSVIKIPPPIVEKQTENTKAADSKRNSIQTPIRRLSSQITPSTTRRPSIKRKESAKHGNVKITGPINDKTPPTRCSSGVYPLEGIMSSRSKIYKGNNGKQPKTTSPVAGLPKVEEDIAEQNKNYEKNNSNSNDNNNIISPNIVSNGPNEFRARVEVLDVIQTEPEKAPTSDIVSHNNEESEKNSNKEKFPEMPKDNKNFRIDPTVSDKERMPCNGNINNYSKDNEEMLIKIDSMEPSKLKGTTANKLFEDKATTAINKEDIVIKLNIDIWCHSKNPNETTITASYPQYNISTHKESQPNRSDEPISRNRSLAANSPGASFDCKKDDQSVIIIKCLSQHINEENPNTEGSTKSPNNKGFIMFLPILQVDESKDCHCFNELVQITRQSRTPSIRIPVKRTTSCLSLLHTMSYYGSGEGLLGGNALNQSKEPKLSRDKGSTMIKKSVVMQRDHVCGRLQYASSIGTESYNTEVGIVEQGTDFTLPVKTVESSTQTEWCNLMMEARLQSDGHYAFYLPSLETLKKYKLHVYYLTVLFLTKYKYLSFLSDKLNRPTG